MKVTVPLSAALLYYTIQYTNTVRFTSKFRLRFEQKVHTQDFKLVVDYRDSQLSVCLVVINLTFSCIEGYSMPPVKVLVTEIKIFDLCKVGLIAGLKLLIASSSVVQRSNCSHTLLID